MKRFSLTTTTLFTLLLTFMVGATHSLFGQNQWTQRSYVDEFGDKTDQIYYSYLAEGVFSNSATTNSQLMAIFDLNLKNEYVGIRLYEYGNRQQKHLIYGDKLCDGIVKVKNLSDNTIQTYKASLSKKLVISTSNVSNSFFEFIKKSRMQTTNVKILIDMENFCEQVASSAIYTIKYTHTPIND